MPFFPLFILLIVCVLLFSGLLGSVLVPISNFTFWSNFFFFWSMASRTGKSALWFNSCRSTQSGYSGHGVTLEDARMLQCKGAGRRAWRGTAAIGDKATGKQGNENYGEGGMAWIPQSRKSHNHLHQANGRHRAGKPPTNTTRLVPKPGLTPAHCNTVG